MTPDALFYQFKSRGVLVDTNLMLLLVVGTYRAQRILTWKRTTQYRIEDFHLLRKIVAFFDRRFTTPNILTEVDDYLRQMHEQEHTAVSEVLLSITRNSFEVYEQSARIMQTDFYPRVGLADSVTIAAAKDVLVLTDDLKLVHWIFAAGGTAVNINHLRSF